MHDREQPNGPAEHARPVRWAGFGPRSVDGGLDEVPVSPRPRSAESGSVESGSGGSGSIWLCGKHVVGPDPEAALVRARGAGLIVCLNQRHELADRYPQYLDWLRAESGRRALWLPIPDLHAPTIEEVRPVVDRIVRALPSGVVIHCGAGIGRAPTVAICVLLTVGYPLDAALHLVAERRPMAGPESGTQRTLVEAFATDAPTGR